MKRFQKGVLFFCTLVFVQCTSKEVSDNIPSLFPLEQSTEVSDLNPYIEDMEFIQFEEGEDSFLSNIRKLLIDKKGNFIVRDMSGTVKVFNPAGKFLFNVGRKGRGPGEYLSASEISLDETGDKIFVMSLGSVLIYNVSDGRFIRQVETPKRDFEAICASGNGGFFLFSCNPGQEDLANFDKDFFAMNQFDAEGKQVGEFLPRKDFVLTEGIFTQSYDGGYYLRPQEGDNILYKVTGDKIVSQYHIDFGNKAIPVRYIFEGGERPWGNLQNFIGANYHKIPIYFHDTENQLYFASIGPGGYNNNFLYLLPETKAIHWVDKIIDNAAPTPVVASDSNSLYVSMVGIGIYLESNEEDLNPMARAIIQEFKKRGNTWTTENPVLVKMQFKIWP